jgi:hypothetical protein
MNWALALTAKLKRSRCGQKLPTGAGRAYLLHPDRQERMAATISRRNQRLSAGSTSIFMLRKSKSNEGTKIDSSSTYNKDRLGTSAQGADAYLGRSSW